jgi:hypothetical protein
VGYRTEIQIALILAGMIVWGYGQRSENKVLQYTGLAFFAAATALRLFKKQPKDDDAPSDDRER